MSFILDALRKSEHARQKQTGPGLAEVPVVLSRPRSNVWATAAVALLVVNLVAVGVLLVRRANKDEPAPAAIATATNGGAANADGAPAPSVAGSAAAPVKTHEPAGAVPSFAPTTQSPVTQGATPRRPPAPADPGRNPLAEEVAGAPSRVDPTLAAGAASVPSGPPAVTRQGGVRPGSVVYAPVPEAPDVPYSPPPASVAPAPATPSAEALPTADEVTARGGLPELHLDLHVYSNQPQQRFIFVNSRKYRDGDTLQEGPVVEKITPDGAVLNFRGSRFKLSND